VKPEGLKQTDDESDAFWLAHLMRLNLLPLGYIYLKAERAVHDLLRKRLQLVRCRVPHLLSTQNQLWRSTGHKVDSKRINKPTAASRRSGGSPPIAAAYGASG
jgi:transposase